MTAPAVITDLSGDLAEHDDGTVDVVIDSGPTLRFPHRESLRSWLRCIETELDA
jgi:hypothetical protein